MVRYRCEKCNFGFDKASPPKLCPFCGKEGSVYEEGDATTILKDVDSMLE
jgi:rubrerythrin